MDEEIKLTLTCKCAAPSAPGLGAIIVELLAFFAVAGLIALAGGCTMLWW